MEKSRAMRTRKLATPWFIYRPGKFVNIGFGPSINHKKDLMA